MGPPRPRQSYWHDVVYRTRSGQNGLVEKRTRQRLITIGLLTAVGLVVLSGIIFQGGGSSTPSVAVSELPATPGDIGAQPTATSALVTNPVEGFLPRSGEASACREPVGVDLIPGYAATLTINGVVIAPEQMNVVLDPSGNISNEQTASRTLAQFTFGPEEDCPNGSVIRATDNNLRACVYRVEDGPNNCVIYESSFDVL